MCTSVLIFLQVCPILSRYSLFEKYPGTLKIGTRVLSKFTLIKNDTSIPESIHSVKTFKHLIFQKKSTDLSKKHRFRYINI